MVGDYSKDAQLPDMYKGSEIYDTIAHVVRTPTIFVTYQDTQVYIYTGSNTQENSSFMRVWPKCVQRLQINCVQNSGPNVWMIQL